MYRRATNWRLPVITAALLSAAACADEATQSEGNALSGDTAAPSVALGASIAQIDVINVDIGEFFIEIDDLNGTAAGNRDANLCSDAPNATGGSVIAQPSGPGTACPNPLTGEGGVVADNPNFPGPDPLNPNTLGTDESLYVDWASLDPAVHLDPFEDASSPDDILSPGACYKADGNSPPKANFTVTGFAANDTYLYVLQEREKHQGNEEYHFFFTQTPPTLESNGCEKWLWDLQNGDVEVVISYPSTAGLPQAQVFISRWTGGALADQDGEDLVASPNWTLDSSPNLAHVAINIAPDRKAEPTEDTEFDFDGTALASGLKTEIAIDIAAVFGLGCGLDRTVAGISTAAQGPNDDLKDFLSPRTLRTGVAEARIDLLGSCVPEEDANLEEIDYEVFVKDPDGDTFSAVDPSEYQIDLEVDCGFGVVSLTDVAQSGTLSGSDLGTDVVFPAECEVTAFLTGEGQFANCDADDADTATVFEELTATLGAGAADVCPVDAADILDAFPFNVEVSGGSGDYSIVWGATGDAQNNTCATETEYELADFPLNCEFDLDPTVSCAEGSITATITDDVCGSSVGPLAIAASRTIERTVVAGCVEDADCAAGEACGSNAFCEPAP